MKPFRTSLTRTTRSGIRCSRPRSGRPLCSVAAHRRRAGTDPRRSGSAALALDRGDLVGGTSLGRRSPGRYHPTCDSRTYAVFEMSPSVRSTAAREQMSGASSITSPSEICPAAAGHRRDHGRHALDVQVWRGVIGSRSTSGPSRAAPPPRSLRRGPGSGRARVPTRRPRRGPPLGAMSAGDLSPLRDRHAAITTPARGSAPATAPS